MEKNKPDVKPPHTKEDARKESPRISVGLRLESKEVVILVTAFEKILEIGLTETNARIFAAQVLMAADKVAPPKSPIILPYQ